MTLISNIQFRIHWMMRLALVWTVLVWTAVNCVCGCRLQADDSNTDGFVSIFDGRTLDGWQAVPESSSSDWKAENGSIVGVGSARRQVYLVWKERNLKDFELRLKVRLLTEGNTGVEIRARPDPSGRRPFEGYHADFGHAGIGPNVLGAWDFHFAKRKEHPCPVGTRLEIGKDQQATSTKLENAFRESDLRSNDWNDLRIFARGNHFQFFINGKPASELIDNAESGQLREGAIGLQLHDRGMRVEFKDLALKRLSLP